MAINLRLDLPLSKLEDIPATTKAIHKSNKTRRWTGQVETMGGEAIAEVIRFNGQPVFELDFMKVRQGLCRRPTINDLRLASGHRP